MNDKERLLIDIFYNEDLDMYYCDYNYLPNGLALKNFRDRFLKDLIKTIEDSILRLLDDEDENYDIEFVEDDINWNDKNNPGTLEVVYSTSEKSESDDSEIEIVDDDPVSEDEMIEIYYDEDSGYTLYRVGEKDSNGIITYAVVDDFGEIVDDWESNEEVEDLAIYHFFKSKVYKDFKDIVSKDVIKQIRNNTAYRYDDHLYPTTARQSSIFDDDDYDVEIPYYGKGGYHYTPPKKSTGFLDKLNKSDTLVIHCQDRSTDMLSQIYDGKGWDVLRDGNIDKDELHQLLQNHDRIVMLGHGTPSGLLNVQGPGYVIGEEEVPYLKNKKLFVIWCYAATFMKRHGLHGMCTDNAPSEVWEVRAAGIHDKEYTREYVLENITYWSKLMADVAEKALNGDIDNSIKYVREKYLEKFGHDGMTEFNANTVQRV